MTTSCPLCRSEIEFLVIDGEVVTCEECHMDCEIQVDNSYNETTQTLHSTVILEPLAQFCESPIEYP